MFETDKHKVFQILLNHGSAIAAQQLGGSLTVQSDGPQRGAVFALEIPFVGPPPGLGAGVTM